MNQKNIKQIINALDNKLLIPVGNYNFLINSLTEQIPATSTSLLRAACSELSKRVNLKKTNKLATEEDKGAILVAGVSLLTGLPFGMARWQPNGLENQTAESFKMEYATGELYLNGILPSDRITIVDDFVSTGGTLIALIKTIQRIGAKITGIVCVAEKINYGGIERIKKETGHDVITLLKIDVSGKFSKVIKSK